jgi:hypothetical protein
VGRLGQASILHEEVHVELGVSAENLWFGSMFVDSLGDSLLRSGGGDEGLTVQHLCLELVWGDLGLPVGTREEHVGVWLLCLWLLQVCFLGELVGHLWERSALGLLLELDLHGCIFRGHAQIDLGDVELLLERVRRLVRVWQVALRAV